MWKMCGFGKDLMVKLKSRKEVPSSTQWFVRECPQIACFKKHRNDTPSVPEI